MAPSLTSADWDLRPRVFMSSELRCTLFWTMPHSRRPPNPRSPFNRSRLGVRFGGGVEVAAQGARHLPQLTQRGVTSAYAPKGGDPYGAPPANNDVTAFKPPLTLIALARLARQNIPHEAAGGR